MLGGCDLEWKGMLDVIIALTLPKRHMAMAKTRKRRCIILRVMMN